METTITKKIILSVCIIVFFALSLYIYTTTTMEELTAGAVVPIPADGIIPTGYYNIPNTTNMRPIPDGFKIINQDSSGNGTLQRLTQSEIYATTGSSNDASATSIKNKYLTTIDVEYHDSVEQIQEMDYANTGTWVKDSSGNQVFYPWTAVPKNFTYYTPGSLLYGPFSYVPDYKDSIYLNRRRLETAPLGSFETSLSVDTKDLKYSTV